MKEEEKAKEEPKKEDLESLPSWLWSVLIGICVLILIIGRIIFFSNNNDNSEKTKKSPSQSNYTYDTLSFSGEYGVIKKFPSEKMVAFLESTQPYCVINKNGQEECGEAEEDISDRFGDSESNRELRFRSSNGLNGTIKLRLRDKTQAELDN